MADRGRHQGRRKLIRSFRGGDDSVAWAPIVFGLALFLGLALLFLGLEWNTRPQPAADGQRSEAGPGPTPPKPH
jgi:hypothetical protein